MLEALGEPLSMHLWCCREDQPHSDFVIIDLQIRPPKPLAMIRFGTARQVQELLIDIGIHFVVTHEEYARDSPIPVRNVAPRPSRGRPDAPHVPSAAPAG